MNTKNITELPYAKWLEQSLGDLSSLPVRAISIVAITENGDTYGNYYNSSMVDKLVMSGLIQQDSMLDTMAANGIIEYGDEDDNGETEDDKKEER